MKITILCVYFLMKIDNILNILNIIFNISSIIIAILLLFYLISIFYKNHERTEYILKLLKSKLLLIIFFICVLGKMFLPSQEEMLLIYSNAVTINNAQIEANKPVKPAKRNMNRYGFSIYKEKI